MNQHFHISIQIGQSRKALWYETVGVLQITVVIFSDIKLHFELQPYVHEAKARMAEYMKDLEAWENTMIEEGREDLVRHKRTTVTPTVTPSKSASKGTRKKKESEVSKENKATQTEE